MSSQTPPDPHVRNTRRRRVVLLARPYRLTDYLIEQLVQNVGLTGIVYEQPRSTLSSRAAFLRQHVKRFGLANTCDTLAYLLYQKICRARAMEQTANAILPLRQSHPNRPTIPEYTVTDLNQSTARQLIANLEPDVLVVHATRILRPATIQLADDFAVNLHCGLLPAYRGHDSMFWPLYYGDHDQLGVTIHLLEEQVDTGASLRRERIKWTPEDTDLDLWFTSFRVGVDLLIDLLQCLNQGKPITPYPVSGPHGPHYPHKGLSHFLRYRLRQWMPSGASRSHKRGRWLP